MNKINLGEKLSQFSDYWNPRIVGELNGQHIKLAKFKGPFVWHQHAEEDEMFLVIKGRLHMEFRDRTEFLDPGECIIVPRGTEHRPVAMEEVWVMLFEPSGTLNTGDVENEFTRKNPENI